jgi:tetratricopeptide (TPR) repeat protein
MGTEKHDDGGAGDPGALVARSSPLPVLLLLIPVAPIAIGWVLWTLAPTRLASSLAILDALVVVAGRLTWIALGLGVVVAILWPPLLPGLRLLARRLGRQLAFDRKAARDLVQRLAQLTTSRDLQSLGQLYLDSAQPRHALTPLLKARELEPGQPRLQYLLGRCLFDLGRTAPAMAELEAALATEPGVAFGEGLLIAAHCALRLGNVARAREMAARHEALFGESIRGRYLLARAAHRLGEKQERAEHLRRLRAMPPGMGKRYSAEEAMARARARVARFTGGEP